MKCIERTLVGVGMLVGATLAGCSSEYDDSNTSYSEAPRAEYYGASSNEDSYDTPELLEEGGFSMPLYVGSIALIATIGVASAEMIKHIRELDKQGSTNNHIG